MTSTEILIIKKKEVVYKKNANNNKLYSDDIIDEITRVILIKISLETTIVLCALILFTTYYLT